MRTLRFLINKLNGWSVLSVIFIVLILSPNIDILIHMFNTPNENWIHIKAYLLKAYVINSAILVGMTAVFCMLAGTIMAWLISAYNFPLRIFFKWALILPLAIPPYIAAYTYNGLLNYTGVVQTFLRNDLGIQISPKYFDIMSIYGAVFIFTMVLFPYVYLITRAFLEKQSSSLIENSRLLGKNSFEIFVYVILPISRGAILGGATLVSLEVLNDYGVAAYFGIQTFSTAIFKTWFAMGDIDSALKLAAILMFAVFGIVLLEKILRGKKKYNLSSKVRPIVRKQLTGVPASLAVLICSVFFSFGFVIPTLQLLHWSILTYEKILNIYFIQLIFNSVWVAFVATVLIMMISIVIANFSRMEDNWFSKLISKLTLVGYSIPGAVIAIGVILFIIHLDHKLLWLYKMIDPNSINLVLGTSIVMLLFAYVIRFLAVGYQAVESGFDKVGKKFFEASRMLGKSVTRTFVLVDYPMLKPALISGFALTFVDIMKELPLTLILRPYNFDTLATKTFEYANNEMVHEASIASLIIILVSLSAIYLLYKLGDKEENV